MPSVFQKLNLKDQRHIVVLNAPASFEPELAALRNVAIRRSAQDSDRIEFSLAFVTRQPEIDLHVRTIASRAEGDAVVWFAYPKGTSRNYRCDFNRDTGWKALGEAGFEPVRMVAIDEDWSAIRFRRVEFIKTMTRDKSHRLSQQGNARVARK